MNYNKIYDSLIERAKLRIIEGYTETHHILPKCLGGDDSKENLVDLTPEEHYLAHLLLVKIYPDNIKLIFAAKNMTIGGGHLKRSNKIYGWLRKEFVKAITGRAQSEETRKKISETKKSKNFKHSEEAKKKMRIAAGKQEQTDQKRMKCSDAGKKARGIPKTEEHKKILKEAARNRSRIVCVHCTKQVQINMYRRWHGDKCKARFLAENE